MARKSGRNFRKNIIPRGVASKAFSRITKKRMRRRHKFKSHSHRLVLLKKYFIKSETGADSLVNQCKAPAYRFSTDIPDFYQESYICALPINPGLMFTYWELAPEYLKKSIDSIETESKLILRIKNRSYLNEDLKNFPEQIQTDCPDASETEIVDYQITEPSGEMIFAVPQTEKDHFTLEVVALDLTGEETVLTSQEIIKNFSNISETFFDCSDVPIDANEYFDESEENDGEKAVIMPPVDLDLRSTTGDYNQYLGSASYENQS